jgi:hypothetical protein
MPPRRKRLDIDVLSSVVSDRVASKPMAKSIVNLRKSIVKHRHIERIDSSSSEHSSPPIIYQRSITESPEKSPVKKSKLKVSIDICPKCYVKINLLNELNNILPYINTKCGGKEMYMHRVCHLLQ